MSKYFVTGATGHLGNVVVKYLLKQGHKVRALILPNEDISPIKGLDLDMVYGDVRDKRFLEQNIHDDEIVIHMAGIIDVSSKKNDLLLDVNVNGTKNIADVCLAKHLRLVYTSSVHTIPAKENDEQLLSEPTEFNPDNIVGAYAKSKTIATGYVFEKCKEGLNVVVVYPSGIIGPCDYKISDIGQVILDHINGKLLAYVKGGYNFVDVRDVAKGVINASQIGVAGEGYILSGNMCSVKHLLEIINQKIGRKKMPPKLALWFVRGFAALSEFYYKVRGKKPSFSAYSLQTLNVNCNFDNSKAKKALNFVTRDTKQSIEDAVDWFYKNKPECLKNKAIQPA